MLLILQRFSFEIHYRKGNDIIFIDHLCQNILLRNGPERRETAPGLDCISIAVLSEVPNVTQNHLGRIRSSPQCVLSVQALLAVKIEEWPVDKSKLNSFIQDF